MSAVLVQDHPDLAQRLKALPGRLFSGKQHPSPGARAVFFCYSLPATTVTPGAQADETPVWIEEAAGLSVRHSMQDVYRSRLSLRARCLAILGMFLLPLVTPAQEPPGQAQPSDITQMSIEDLMNVRTTSVSKKEQEISHVAAAVFVITEEDIRRSRATNIADLPRMVPGMDVAQINANSWAISARGFNSQFANKLLVLVDGQAVYTPTLGGVYWDSLAVPLEDIERIEVIRGPGGTIWGANAVNGVINVITKKTADTLGALVTGGGGTADQPSGTLQYGSRIGDDASFRVFTNI